MYDELRDNLTLTTDACEWSSGATKIEVEQQQRAPQNRDDITKLMITSRPHMAATAR